MIKLAREAGWEYANNYSGFDPLWKFGELVAAAEREACAQLLLSTDLSGLSPDYALQNLIANLLANYAAAIRARGQHDKLD
jgi:hypothetical protein